MTTLRTIVRRLTLKGRGAASRANEPLGHSTLRHEERPPHDLCAELATALDRLVRYAERYHSASIGFLAHDEHVAALLEEYRQREGSPVTVRPGSSQSDDQGRGKASSPGETLRMWRYLRSWVETIAVLLDRETMRALRDAESEPDHLARDYDDVRRDQGLPDRKGNR